MFSANARPLTKRWPWLDLSNAALSHTQSSSLVLENHLHTSYAIIPAQDSYFNSFDSYTSGSYRNLYYTPKSSFLLQDQDQVPHLIINEPIASIFEVWRHIFNYRFMLFKFWCTKKCHNDRQLDKHLIGRIVSMFESLFGDPTRDGTVSKWMSPGLIAICTRGLTSDVSCRGKPSANVPF